MRLITLSLRGITRFLDPVSVHFGDLPDGLVAVVGPNGAGKTTILEAAYLALYKQFASRPGSIYAYATGRDAYVRATFEDANLTIDVDLRIDAEARKTAGYVRVNGETVSDGKAGSFDAAIARYFGSSDLFLASVFASQDKSGSFLGATRGDRRAILRELLGFGRLDDLTVAAASRGAEARSLADGARSFADALFDRAGDPDVLAGETLQAETDQAAAVERLSARTLDRSDAAERLRQAQEAVASIAPLQAAERAAGDRRRAAEQAETRARDQVDRAEDAIERVGEASGLASAEAALAHATMDHAAASKTRSANLASLRRAFDQLASDADVAGAEGRLREAAAAAEAVVRLRGRVREIEDALRRDQSQIDQRVADLERSASLLAGVPCASLPDLTSTCQLLADARKAAEALPTIPRVSDFVPRLESAQRESAAAEDLAPSAGEVQSLERALSDAKAADGLRTQIQRAEHSAALLDEQERKAIAAADVGVSEARTRRERLEREAQQAIHAALDAMAIARAEGDSRRAEHEHAVAALAKTQATLATVDVEAIKRALAEAAHAVAQAEQDVAAAAKRHATAEALYERACQDRQAAADARAAAWEAAEHASDWERLRLALGPAGIQAMRIDVAVPELGSLVNELLRSCYGPRFGVEFRTQREKVSARGEVSEVLDLIVYDGAQERTVEALSGGERTIVGEAVSLALAILNARRNSVRWRTIWRDETAGALDPENAARYVAMLRRGRELAGAAQVIFVAHQPEVWQAADAVVHVEDGKTSVRHEQEAAA